MPKKTTESDSRYQHIEKMSIREMLVSINQEDQQVPLVIAEILPAIEKVVDAAYNCLSKGGRLFYMGAGTSGRLGVLDASELPPTFGADSDSVIGLIAGGDVALRTAVEFAEDDVEGGWRELQAYQVSDKDLILGIAASGTTPYVVGALERAQNNGIRTACIVCNADAPLEGVADLPIVAVLGPEFITGSTRMKAGTAQKLILNMISTSVMVKLGRVAGNKMVDMQLNNQKLRLRAQEMIVEATGLKAEQALVLLEKHGSVRRAIAQFRANQ